MTQVTWVTAFISDLGLDRAWEAGDIVSPDLAPSPNPKGILELGGSWSWGWGEMAAGKEKSPLFSKDCGCIKQIIYH